MDQSTALYFIALIPSETICKRVEAVKQVIKKQYQAKNALKSPAHITIQRPFRRPILFESELNATLLRFSKNWEAFQVNLSGFGSFAPRVIFIKPINVEAVLALHQALHAELMQLGFSEKEMNQSINPHLTLATRDLSELQYHNAWNEFKNKEFDAHFQVQSVFLFKHNGKTWDILSEFTFRR